MSDSGSFSELVMELAEEFLERYRKGERPALAEYIKQHPQLDAEIREVFPAMAMMENIAIDDPSLAGGSFDADSPAAEPAVTEIGDYRVLREVGRGGMGIVYEAEQLSLGRRVALKVLPQQMLLDKKHKRRFEREAKAAARLHHTNIVPVFGVGEHDGLHYYVMQFIQGLGLDEVIQELRRLKETQHSAGEDSKGQGGSPSDGSARRVARSLITGEYERTVLTSGESEGEDGDVPATVVSARPAVHQSGHGALELSMSGAGLSDSSSINVSESLHLSGVHSLSGQSDASTSTASRARRKQTFWTSVAQIGQQVASALQYAHEQGVTHRDIKPSNLLLDMRGTVWVTDFGLAKATDQQDITHTGDILGTLRYMPPEAFDGKSGPSGDLYALGLTLYEMLAQKPAFEEKDRHKLIKLVTTSEPQRIEKLNPDVPRDLATIVHKAIDRDPAHRYQTAGEFEDDLQRFLDDEPIKARRISTVERIARWRRRNKGLAAALSAVAVLLLVINIVGPVLTWRIWEEQDKLRQSEADLRVTVDKLRLRETELEETGKQLENKTKAAQASAAEADRQRGLTRQALYSSALFGAENAISTPGGYTRARELLDEVRPQAEETDLRGWEWHFVNSQLARESTVLSGFAAVPYCAAFSPDGKLLATGDGSGAVKLFAAESGRLKQTLRGHRESIWSLAWSPNGKRLASAGSDKSARIWNLETGKAELQLVGHTRSVTDIAWSPDGTRVVTGSLDGTVKTWDSVSGASLLTIEKLGEIRGVDWSPDGRRLASGSRDKTVRVWNAETGAAMQILQGHTGTYIAHVRFSPDGRRIASSCWGTTQKPLIVWDVERGEEVLSLEEATSGIVGFSWSPDGSRLATTEASGEFVPGAVDVWDAGTGKKIRSLTGHTGSVYKCSWSADGCRLASTSVDGTVRIWNVADAPPSPDFTGHKGRIPWLAWSHDGARLATAGIDKTVKVWDAATRQCLLTFDRHTTIVHSLDWDPESTRLVSCGNARVFHIWEAETGRVLHTIEATSTGTVYAVTWSPDGTQIATAGEDGTVRIFDAETEEEDHRFSLKLGTYSRGLDWSPDGRRLAAAADTGDVIVWDVATEKAVAQFRKPDQSFFAVRFSPTGSRLAAGGVRKLQKTVFGDTGAGTEGTVIVWDLKSEQERHQLHGHSADVRSLDWSVNGTRLISAGHDGRTIVWDTATGRQLLAIRDPENKPVLAAQFSPDELQIASAGDAPGVRLWDATPSYAVELSEKLLPALETRIEVHPTFDDLKFHGEILAKQCRWNEAAASFEKAAALAAGGTGEGADRWFTSPWWVTGPYPEPLDTQPPAQTNLNPLVPVPRLNDNAGEPLHWELTVLEADQGLNLGRFFHQAKQISGYAQLRVYSPVEQDVGVLFGAEDCVRLWFRDELVHSRQTPRSAVRDDEAVDVTLQHGWNTLLAKVSNSAGGHGLFLRLSDDPITVARVFARNEKWDEALVWWERAYAERPTDLDVLLGRGSAALGLGQMDVAEQSFDAVLAGKEPFAVRGVASAYVRQAQSLIAAGKTHDAAEMLAEARTLYEVLLSGDGAVDQDAASLADVLLTDGDEWTPLAPIEMTSAGGATLTRLDDGSILAGGDNLTGDVYTIRAKANIPEIRAVRLEVLPDPSLPKRGPGRHQSGNFQLKAFRVFGGTDDDGEPADQLPIADAWASFAFNVSGNGSVLGTIRDGDPRFWHVYGRPGERHIAIFKLSRPWRIQPGQALIVRCAHTDREAGVNLGRFRLSVSDAPRAFDTNARRFAVSQIEDPKERLGAAYVARGDSKQAAQWFARALEQTPDFAARRGLVERISQLETDLSDLISIRPDDPLLLGALAKQQAGGGRAKAAAASLAKARSLTEAMLAQDPHDGSVAAFLADLLLAATTHWTVLKPIELKSAGGATLTKQDDNSVLAGGSNPDRDLYTVTADTDVQKITAIRLEALTDDSLPGRGPGRASFGRFVMDRIRVAAAPREDPDSLVDCTLDAACADDFYPQRPIMPNGAWHVAAGGAGGTPRVAIYRLGAQQPLPENARLRFEMTFHHGPDYPGLNLGRFRLSVTDDPAAFTTNDRRFTASRIADPRLRLGAAYACLGESAQATEWCARSLGRTAKFAARLKIAERIDELPVNLDDLIALRPNDPMLLRALAKRRAADGQADAAAKSLAKARRLTERLLARSPDDEAVAAFLADLMLAAPTPTPPVSWTVLRSIHVDSENGERFTAEDDGSVFVSGPNPERAVYTIRCRIPSSMVSCLRIETLPDARLPEGGAGRYPGNGNFHLSEVTLATASADSSSGSTPVDIAGALADDQKSDDDAATNMIDGDPRTRWEVFPGQTEPHAVLIRPATPVRSGDGELLITLDSGISKWGQHGLGRFRLSVTGDPAAFELPWRRSTALRVQNPWLKLGAAYSIDGNPDAATQSYARALDRETDFAARLTLLDRIADLHPDLSHLESLRPDDPVFDWLGWLRRFRESGGTTDAGRRVGKFLEFLESAADIDLRILYGFPEFRSVVDTGRFEGMLEQQSAQSSPIVRQQIWTKRPPRPFAAQWQRTRERLEDLIAQYHSKGLRPAFLSASRVFDRPEQFFVTNWTKDGRDYRIELDLTRRQLDELLNTLPQDMQLASLEEYGEGKSTRCAALWVKQTTPAPWELHERLSESEVRMLAETMRGRGFRPTYVNAYPDGTLTTVWAKDDGQTELLPGLTHRDLMQLERERADDCLPIWIDSYFDGRRRRYSVLVDNGITKVAWKFTLLVVDREIQSVTNESFQAGWKPVATTDSPVGRAADGAK